MKKDFYHSRIQASLPAFAIRKQLTHSGHDMHGCTDHDMSNHVRTLLLQWVSRRSGERFPEIDIIMDDQHCAFTPSNIQVEAGETVSFFLSRNVGQVPA